MTTHKHRFSVYTTLLAVLPGLAALWMPQHAAVSAETSGLAPVIIEKVSVARQLNLLRAICEPGQVAIRDAVPVCGTCPSYMTGGTAGLRIINVIEGNFTRPGAPEVLVDIAGCEPDVASGGGTVLLEAHEQGWRRTLYQAGLRSNECVRFRTMRQTVSLACNISRTVRGIQRGELTWLSLREDKPVRQPLLEWYDNSQSNPRRLISIFPFRFMKSDFNSDGRVDLQVSMRLRDEIVPDKYPGFTDAMLAGHRFKKAKTLRLVFLSDGSSLELAPISDAARSEMDTLLKQIRDR